ncbi:MAG: NADP-dependent phosphogluconate dehydrogenase [Deltaproteobacteria bacterium]|nr:NADP-dependent phosphogluconate dehydrogenase [Deltaproteobacteria bacterium]
MKFPEIEIGLAGLGVMGRNLALNIADRGAAVAVYNRTAGVTRNFIEHEVGNRAIYPAYSIAEFIDLQPKPRAIIILVQSGPPVDMVLKELLLFLDPGDTVIDAGNSHFIDTNRRAKVLANRNLFFVGMGISGGEAGARHGPSLMPGGSRKGYDRVQAIFNAIAAKANSEPCVAYIGAGSAGHYTKMVHNGVEYGLMQLIAESYDLLKRGAGLSVDELAEIYSRWNQEELNSYLIEITAKIFKYRDTATDRPLVDLILDAAKQKGTGKWTSWDAMDLMVPTPSIDIAVAMRGLSSHKAERREASQVLHGPEIKFVGDRDRFITQMKNALFASMLVTFAQGLAQLREASLVYNYGINLESVAKVWRGGCIIRAGLLEGIRAAYRAKPDLPNLLLDPQFAKKLMERQADWREVVKTAVGWGIPVPGLAVSLAYFDGYRSEWLPANLIQAQRDYFGAHTYERLDKEGQFHTDWEKI